jgi:hypothetical protein
VQVREPRPVTALHGLGSARCLPSLPSLPTACRSLCGSGGEECLGGLAVSTLKETAVLGGGRCYVVRGLFQPVLWVGIDRTLAGAQKIYAEENREGTLGFAISFCSAPQVTFGRGD